MATWDRRTPAAQAKVRDAALRAQLRDRVGPFSPYWRERFAALRTRATAVGTAADLARLPAVGERDVCPDGDPAGMARLVLQADEAGFALHAPGPDLRKALIRRMLGRATYRRQVEAGIRPTTYHFAGRSFEFPVAWTRADADLVARAGNRAWQVLGLGAADVLVSAVPVAARLDHLFLSYAALGAGAPALFPGDDPERVARTLALVPATVLAARAADAAGVVEALDRAGADLRGLTTLLLTGPPSADDRLAAGEALAVAGNATAAVLALYGPDEGRVLWAECREGAARGTGYHTYPDLDLVEVLAPDTGEPAPADGELAVTQLGFGGTALLRWRTGDLVPAPIETGACPGCGRTVPRIPDGVRTGALQPSLALRGRAPELLDLRAVAGALAGRPDLADWRIEARRSERDGADELVLLVVPTGDETEAAVGAYRDVRAAVGFPPTQIVVVDRVERPRFDIRR